MVLGLESGGTSTAAGILHHLGVRMGKLNLETAKTADNLLKAFNTYECMDLVKAIKRQAGGRFNFDDFGNAVINYIAKRHHEAGGTRAGFKNVATATLGMMRKSALDKLPIEIFQIKRDLNKVFDSVIKYRGVDYQCVSQVAAGYLSIQQLVLKMPPVLSLNYEDILADPRGSVEQVRDAFGLKVTNRQFERAVKFVDPEGCAKNVVHEELRVPVEGEEPLKK